MFDYLYPYNRYNYSALRDTALSALGTQVYRNAKTLSGFNTPLSTLYKWRQANSKRAHAEAKAYVRHKKYISQQTKPFGYSKTYSRNMPKRYRNYKRSYRTRRKRFRPGYDRTGGNYGRYNAPGSKGADLKFFDMYANTSTYGAGRGFVKWGDDVVNGSTESMVSGIITGTSPNTRTNQKIVIKSIQITGVLRSSNASTAFNHAKYCLVLDKQCNGANPSTGDLFTQVGTGNTSYLANHRVMANSQRFTILKTWIVDLNNKVAAVGVSKAINFYHKCNIPIEYTSGVGTAAVADVKSNNLFIMRMHDADLTNNLAFRIRYRD